MRNSLQKITAIFMFAMFAWAPIFANETEGPAPADKAKTEVKSEAANQALKLVDRLDEIRILDFENMERTEKKELRKEVREIRNGLNALAKSDAQAKAIADGQNTRGIYISVGGAIIIVLLLILLL